MKPFFVYLLKCSDGSYYAGHTDDLDVRLQQHETAESGYTATRKPVELVWQGEFETREGALAFELQIKGWSRVKKEALIRGDWTAIQKHAWGTRNPLPAHLAGDSPSIPQGEWVLDSPTVSQAIPMCEAVPIPVRPEVSKGAERPEHVEGPEVSKGAEHPEPVEGPEVSKGAERPEPVEGPEVSKGLPADGNAPIRQPDTKSPQALLESLLGRTSPTQRRAIAKSITLLESTRADHRAQGDELLTALLPHTGKAFRLGISGVPGVGKSTFIEALGLYLIKQGHRVAVLTIDPSSTVSGGSILGDKTRMEMLSVHENAYIRPSPSSGTLGGVAEKTREAMLVCEAAAYDIVIVETVGVGQSETAVANMTDMFVLMQLPNAGDDLQAIKKGVMELADLVVINKADIDAIAAQRAQLQITSAMQLLGMFSGYVESHWHPKAIQISALNGQGVEAFWAAVLDFRARQSASGKFAERRQQQSLSWMWERIDAGLKQVFRQNPAVSALLPDMLAQVAGGRLPASTAARNLLLAQAQRA